MVWVYRKAIELGPKNAINTANFAVFMNDVRKNYEEAERLYRKALELDPKYATNIGNFAYFMEIIRTNFNEANRLYRQALALDSNSKWIKTQFTRFLKEHPDFYK
ncbi:MAG TPA: tetratricopeptide repeat protein [Chitinivibrionales bacterium]|nr:tetratricopeptide repeat protein [Chitinivibrionales bacterium]